MADHPAVHASHTPRLSDGKRRKVVVEHEALFHILELDCVHELRLAGATERYRAEDVRLAAIEEARAVDDRREAACLGEERTYFIKSAPVYASVFLKRERVYIRVDRVLEKGVKFRGLNLLEALFSAAHPLRFARIDVAFRECALLRVEAGTDDLIEERREARVVRCGRRQCYLFDSAFGNYLRLPRLQLLDFFARALQGGRERVFRNFARADLDHVDEAVLAAGEKIHTRAGRHLFLTLLVGWVDDELVAPLFEPQPHRRYGTVPGDV